MGAEGAQYASFNPIRDTIFCGNRQAYNTFGTISIAASSLFTLGAGAFAAGTTAAQAGTSVARALGVYAGKTAASVGAGIGGGFAGQQVALAFGAGNTVANIFGVLGGVGAGLASGLGLQYLDKTHNWSGFYRVGSTLNTSNAMNDDSPVNPSDIAKADQGNDTYPGVDDWSDVTLQEGEVYYRGEPNGSDFFTDRASIDSVGANKNALFEGLQVQPHRTLGYRGTMQGYRLRTDLSAAEAQCLANSMYGTGGLHQQFIPNANVLIEQGILVPVETIILH